MTESTTYGELRVMIDTVAFDDTCDFYREVLRLQAREAFGEAGSRGIMFELGNNVIEIFERDAATVSGVAVSVEVDDLHTLWSRLERQATIVFPPRHNAWGDSSFCVQDPNGFALTFFQLVASSNSDG